MTHKKFFSLATVAILLMTSQQNHAMNFNKRELGIIFGGLVIGWVGTYIGTYIWENIQPRIPRTDLRKIKIVPAVTANSTSPVYAAPTTTTNKTVEFNQVNDLVKQLGPNVFIGFYIDHNAPENYSLWKDCFKYSEIAFDATNGLVNYTSKTGHKDYRFVSKTSDDSFSISTGASNGEIIFDEKKNVARLYVGQSTTRQLRTFQSKDL